MFFKMNFDKYYDRVWDACEDTGVGVPCEESNAKYADYFKTVVAPNGYKDFARWLYNKGFALDAEIDFFNKKYLSCKNHREATFQVLEFEFEKWIYEIWSTVIDV